jgi:MYXO-CTERM domain-containing protein
MRVTYSGLVAADADEVWDRLRDVDGVIDLLPGAGLTRDGDRVVGSLRVRPSAQVTYKITSAAATDPESDRVATIAVTGTEARGDGTLAATVTIAVSDEGSGSGLAATADIEATGRAADADENGWKRVLEGLGSAFVASFERVPAGVPAPTPDVVVIPDLEPTHLPAVAPMPTSEASPTPHRRPKLSIALGVLVALTVLRRRRKHRRFGGSASTA